MKDYERMERIKELESLIQRARLAYWEYGVEKWTDAEYDEMKAELEAMKRGN